MESKTIKSSFCDLNIKKKFCVAAASESGYRYTALDHCITIKKMLSLTDLNESKQKNSNDENNTLTRLTVLLDESSNMDALAANLANVQKYDIVSVMPLTEKTFNFACDKLDHIHIITIDTNSGLKFHVSPGAVKSAVERGIYFEALYGEAVSNPSARKFFMSGIADISRATRGGRHLILSSGCENMYSLRRPYDIINLLKVMGLKHAEKALTSYPLDVIARARRRREMR